MSIAVVIFFGAILLLGVLFLIVGKSKEQIDKMPNLPDKFDRDLIQRRLVEVQYSPNILTSYAKALAVRFQGSAERLALGEILSQNKMLSGIFETEKDVFEALIGKTEAKTDCEIALDPKMQKLKKKDKKLFFEESIAIKNARIQNVKQGKNDGDAILKEYEKKLINDKEKKVINRRVRTEEKIDAINQDLEEVDRLLAEKEKRKNKILDKCKDDQSPEALRKCAKELEDMEDYFNNILDRG